VRGYASGSRKCRGSSADAEAACAGFADSVKGTPVFQTSLSDDLAIIQAQQFEMTTSSFLHKIVAVSILAIALATNFKAVAEADSNKFYPVALECPANDHEACVFVMGNAARHFTRWKIVNGRLTWWVSNPATQNRYKQLFELVIGVDSPTGNISLILEGTLKQHRALRERICEGGTEEIRRYSEFLETNRRTIGAVPLPTE